MLNIENQLSKYIVIFILLFGIKAYSQDNLFLVGTIIGESADKNITDVKGIGDINGDGYDDFMVSMRTGMHVSDQGIEKLYLGSADGKLIPNVTFHYPDKETYNNLISAFGIGDVNGDGYSDFAIWSNCSYSSKTTGKVFLYFGGVSIDTVPDAEFYELGYDDNFGSYMTGVGDINEDGYNDFIISSPFNWESSLHGRVNLLWGGNSISLEKSTTFVGNQSDCLGESAANIGDINNDGFDDLAIGAPDFNLNSGKFYIYYGGATLKNIPDTMLSDNGFDDRFGSVIKNAGNLNNNSAHNFCVSSSHYIYVYTNGLNNPLLISGYSFDCNGDVNNDEFNDLIIGNNNKINIYFGSENFDTTADIIVDDSLEYSPKYVYLLGDLNHDGFDEVACFAPNYPNTQYPQGRINIYSYKKFTNVKDYKGNIPGEFKLYQNYPNPFNPITTIKYSIPQSCFVALKIFDALGKEITTLVNEEKSAGIYKINFNAGKYASGVYFYQLKTNDMIVTKKMILLQ